MSGLMCVECGREATEGLMRRPYCKKHWSKLTKEEKEKVMNS